MPTRRGNAECGVQDFKKLEVWQLAHQLTIQLYRVCDRRFSRYPSLRSQTLRAAQSIGANIAEGSGAERIEFGRFLGHALRSTLELENNLLLARDLAIISTSEFTMTDARISVLRRKLISLICRTRGV